MNDERTISDLTVEEFDELRNDWIENGRGLDHPYIKMPLSGRYRKKFVEPLVQFG